jgi:hypothetical protein
MGFVKTANDAIDEKGMVNESFFRSYVYRICVVVFRMQFFALHQYVQNVDNGVRFQFPKVVCL